MLIIVVSSVLGGVVFLIIVGLAVHVWGGGTSLTQAAKQVAAENAAAIAAADARFHYAYRSVPMARPPPPMHYGY
eukprot:1997510-Rhodomonas_salina.2